MKTVDHLHYHPLPAPADLRAQLAESHRCTMDLADRAVVAVSADPAAMTMPFLPIVNPLPWELGHVAWFQEFWALRRGDDRAPARLKQADALFNSSLVPHDTRWDLPLPPLTRLRTYLVDVFEATDTLLASSGAEDDAGLRYFAQLALYHQDMHNEAFAYSFQTAGWAGFVPSEPALAPPSRDRHFDDATIEAGAAPGAGFVFDNEKWAHAVPVPAFAIAEAVVTHGDYRSFVEGDPAQRTPRYWRRRGGVWEVRVFDQWCVPADRSPVCHVSASEAEAYCRWRGRRLPTEFEWLRLAQACPELAFAGVWEWTASVFGPFPGFTPDPYEDYSRPWFDGSYRVLKGGSVFTPTRMRRAGFRNFYRPDRGDVFCGFRTCATGPL